MTSRPSTPPWPVFWLGTALLWTLPRGAGPWWTELLDLLGIAPDPARELTASGLLRIANLVDLVGPLVIVTAVVTVFGAGIRGRFIESRYNLRAAAPVGAVAEMAEYARAQLPNIEVRVNLVRARQTSFAYFRGPRRPRLAVFGSLVKLWRSDRRAAEAVVRHEVNHCRQGDNALLGAVSPFEFVLRHWLLLFVCAVLIPTSAVWLANAIDFLRTTGGTSHTLGQLLTHVLPGLLLTLAGSGARLFAALTMAIAASWSAELGADQAAALVDPQGTIGALAHTDRPGGSRHWLFGRITHPPRALRRAALRGGPTTAIVCYPLGWLVLLFWELVAANASFLVDEVPATDILHENGRLTLLWIGSMWPLWLAAAGFMLLWSVLRRALS
ncbi:M48 family metalloprotease [Actinokineospora enzanensis]|uniref:M48 family metalloprotease n=1 Tax=Actinokineospora enzanensis TaxID=155975 RepID=UPI0003A5A668|nr:M48 family metalloprotease [Actinokineospora enzanensis]